MANLVLLAGIGLDDPIDLEQDRGMSNQRSPFAKAAKSP
jgi:hypothetical protein